MRKLLILVFLLGIAVSGCVATGDPSRGVVEAPKGHHSGDEHSEGDTHSEGEGAKEGETHSEGTATEEAHSDATKEGETHSEGDAKPTEESHSEGSPTAEPTQEATPHSQLPKSSPDVAIAYSRQTLREVTIFLGYIPNVQFAPLYVGVEQGFFGMRV